MDLEWFVMPLSDYGFRIMDPELFVVPVMVADEKRQLRTACPFEGFSYGCHGIYWFAVLRGGGGCGS